jgi:hypothetical protein
MQNRFRRIVAAAADAVGTPWAFVAANNGAGARSAQPPDRDSRA